MTADGILQPQELQVVEAGRWEMVGKWLLNGKGNKSMSEWQARVRGEVPGLDITSGLPITKYSNDLWEELDLNGRWLIEFK